MSSKRVIAFLVTVTFLTVTLYLILRTGKGTSLMKKFLVTQEMFLPIKKQEGKTTTRVDEKAPSMKTIIKNLGKNKLKNLFLAADSHGLQLEDVLKRYLPDWNVKVFFYPGYTVQGVLEKVKSLPKSERKAKSFALLHAGTNNFYAHKKPLVEKDSNEVIISSVLSALEEFKTLFPRAAVIYSANLPRGDILPYEERKRFVNENIKTKIADRARTFFVDHTKLFVDSTGMINRTLFDKDRLHLNGLGQDVLVKNLIRTMSIAPPYLVKF